MDRRSVVFIIALTAALFFISKWFGNQDKPAVPPPQVTQQISKPLPSLQQHTGENYFVLQNEWQQLVFSNQGGALVEINLPLRGKTNPESPIRSVSFDEQMPKASPGNDRFPLCSYQIVKNGQELTQMDGSFGNYYPLLRRGFLNSKTRETFRPAPSLYALTLIGSDESLNKSLYQVTRFEENLIEFTLSTKAGKVVKTFSFAKEKEKAPYCFDLFVQLDEELRDLAIQSGVPEVELISGNSSPTLQYRPLTTSGKAQPPVQVSLPKEASSLSGFYPDWICNSNGFFGLILHPLQDAARGLFVDRVLGIKDPSRITLIDTQYNLYPADKYPGYEMQLPFHKSCHFRIYAGPLQQELLTLVDQTYTDPSTGYSPGYTSAMKSHGWFAFISEPFAKFLFLLMQFFHLVTKSWGVSIILLTVALRIMLYPLNAWSIKSTLRMQTIAPKVSAVQERFKKDPKKVQMEIIKLYREEKINPLSGCFPLLIQLPFLIGMFDLLKTTFELRGVPFIPGWIDNLTAPDSILSWNYPLFFFGTDLHLLPLLLGAVMWIQQKMSTKLPSDPSLLTDQQKQQKMMGNIMTVVFMVMFYHFPSGLNIYWLSSMGLGILQQWMAGRKLQPVKSNTIDI